jgi:hypothetical protein
MAELDYNFDELDDETPNQGFKTLEHSGATRPLIPELRDNVRTAACCGACKHYRYRSNSARRGWCSFGFSETVKTTEMAPGLGYFIYASKAEIEAAFPTLPITYTNLVCDQFEESSKVFHAKWERKLVVLSGGEVKAHPKPYDGSVYALALGSEALVKARATEAAIRKEKLPRLRAMRSQKSKKND